MAVQRAATEEMGQRVSQAHPDSLEFLVASARRKALSPVVSGPELPEARAVPVMLGTAVAAAVVVAVMTARSRTTVVAAVEAVVVPAAALEPVAMAVVPAVLRLLSHFTRPQGQLWFARACGHRRLARAAAAESAVRVAQAVVVALASLATKLQAMARMVATVEQAVPAVLAVAVLAVHPLGFYSVRRR